MANNNPIGVLFGVEGGGTLTGASGLLINEQLNGIITAINNSGGLKFTAILDIQTTKSLIEQQLLELQSSLKINITASAKSENSKSSSNPASKIKDVLNDTAKTYSSVSTLVGAFGKKSDTQSASVSASAQSSGQSQEFAAAAENALNIRRQESVVLDTLNNQIIKNTVIEVSAAAIKKVTAAATKGQTAANYGLATSLKAVTSSMGIISLAITGIITLIQIIAPLIKSSSQKFEESAEKAKQLKEEGETLNNELNETTNKIKELEGKKELSLTDKEELKTLRQENAERERKIALNKIEQETAIKNAAQDFNKWAVKQDLSKDIDASKAGNPSLSGYLATLQLADKESSEYKNAQEKLKNLINKDDGLKDKLSTLYESGYTYDPKDDTHEYIDGINTAIDTLLVSTGEVDSALTAAFNSARFDGARKSIMSLVDDEKLSAGSLTDLFKNNKDVQEFVNYLSEIKAIDWKENLGDSFDTFDKDKNGLLDTDELLKACESGSDDFANALLNAVNNIDDIKTKTEEAKNEVTSFVKETKELSNSFTDAKSKKKDIGSIMEEINKGSISSESVSKLITDFADVKGLENYIEILISGKASVEEMRQALAGLFSDYIKQKGIISDVSEKNIGFVKSQLNALGMSNSANIATVSLAASLTKASIAKGDFNKQTAESIRQQMLENGANKKVAEQYIKIASSILKTQSIIKNGATPYAIGNRNQYTMFMLSPKSREDISKNRATEEAQKQLDALLNQLYNDSIYDTTYSTSSSVDTNKSKFDAWYTEQKWKRENNLIDEQTYLASLNDKYKQHFSNRSAYLEEYAKYSQEVYSGFKKLYQDDLNAQKESFEKQKESLKKIADARKEALDDAKEEQDYKKEQSERRQEISKLKTLIASFRGVLSLSSQKKLLELKQQLKEKQEELDEFEHNKSIEQAKADIDKEYARQEEEIQNKIDGIEQLLEDINKEIPAIHREIINFAEKMGIHLSDAYASGTSNSIGGIAITQENGAELIAGNLGKGKFTFLTPASKVWNSGATEFLYAFANSPDGVLSGIAQKIYDFKNRTGAMIYSQPVSINMGGINIAGSADNSTVTKIRSSQQKQTAALLKSFRKIQN